MKALVLSGGAGTRLRPITHTSAEQLVPVADKAVLFHGLESIADAGITQVGMIVGDTFSVGGVTDLVDVVRGSRPDAPVLLTQVPDPRAFGLAEPGPDGQVIGLEEKPQQPRSVHDAVRAIEPYRRGESESIHARIVGPVVIGAGTEVRDSYVGPFTSVAEDCRIVDSEAEYSNVLPDASIEGVARVESSLIGRHVAVTPAPSVPRAHRLVRGDTAA